MSSILELLSPIVETTLSADDGILWSYLGDTVSYLRDTVSTILETPRREFNLMSPILKILSSPIVETLSADVRMLSPIGEILSIIWEILSLQFGETPRGEFHLICEGKVGRRATV